MTVSNAFKLSKLAARNVLNEVQDFFQKVKFRPSIYYEGMLETTLIE